MKHTTMFKGNLVEANTEEELREKLKNLQKDDNELERNDSSAE